MTDRTPATAATDLDSKIVFLGLDDTSRQRLREFSPVVESALPSILDAFYAHVLAVPELKEKLASSSLDALKSAQGSHWSRLFKAEFDRRYLENVRRIGEAPFRNDLAQHWYMGGYCFALNELVAVALKELRRRPDRLL